MRNSSGETGNRGKLGSVRISTRRSAWWEEKKKEEKGLRELDELYTVATTSPRQRQQKKKKEDAPSSARSREQEQTHRNSAPFAAWGNPATPRRLPAGRGPPATACLRADSSPSGRSRPALRAQQRQRKSRPQGKHHANQTNKHLEVRLPQLKAAEANPMPEAEAPNLSGPVISRTSVARLHRCATPGCQLFSPQAKQTSMTDWRKKNPKNMDRLQARKHHAMDSNTSQIPRTRSSRPTSTHRLGRAPERKRKWKRQKRTDLHTNSQAICLYAANNARRSWNEWSAKRRFALQIEAPLYIMSWVHAEADNIHPSSSRIMRHMKKWRRMNRVSNQTAALKARRQKEEAGRDKKNHTRQVCSCLVVVETERKWSPTRCRKSHRWKPNVGAYTTTTKLPSETAPQRQPEPQRTAADG